MTDIRSLTQALFHINIGGGQRLWTEGPLVGLGAGGGCTFPQGGLVSLQNTCKIYVYSLQLSGCKKSFKTVASSCKGLKESPRENFEKKYIWKYAQFRAFWLKKNIL